VTSFLKSFIFAGRGIALGCRGRNFRLMILATLIISGLSWRLALPNSQVALLILCMAVVLSLELFNTAGEMLIDVLSPEHNERYGQIKDVMAGAVLVAAIATSFIGFLIILPPLLARI
jgi:diacylglycerol kinase